MGAACKTPCQKSADGSDEAGLEPTTPVLEPDVSLASVAQSASEEAKVEDDVGAQTDAKLRTVREDAEDVEKQSARQSADESSPTPAEQGVQAAAEDGAAGDIEEAKEDVAAVADQPAKDDLAAGDAATTAKQGEQARKDPTEDQGKTPAIDEATEPSAAVATEAVGKQTSAAKKAPRKAAKAAAKKKKEPENKQAVEVPKKDVDNTNANDDEEFKRTKSEASIDKRRGNERATKVEGWGSVEALQAMFGEDVDEDKDAAESADLAKEYFEAVKLVKHGKPKKGAPNNEEKLILYGLFKQVNCGDNPKSKPGMLSGLEARGKWNAWNSRRGMDKKSAMEEYIKVVKAQKVKYQVVV